MTADRIYIQEERRLLRATLIALILVLASGLLFGAMTGAQDREDEIEEAHNRAARMQNQCMTEHPDVVKQQDEQDSSPVDEPEGDPQPEPAVVD